MRDTTYEALSETAKIIVHQLTSYIYKINIKLHHFFFLELYHFHLISIILIYLFSL